MLDTHRIERESWVRGVEQHDTLDSTNDRALLLAQQDELPVPYLIAAARQTAGRGRGSNRWWADDGALMWSLVLDAGAIGLSAENWPRVSLTAALAVCETVEELIGIGNASGTHGTGRSDGTLVQRQPWSDGLGGTGGLPTSAHNTGGQATRATPPFNVDVALGTGQRDATIGIGNASGTPCGLRWPNDVFVGERKICGVLPELPRPVSSQRPVPQRLVLGVGLNVNNSLAAAPAEVAARGTSLCDLTQQSFDLTDVLLRILARLQQHLNALAESNPILPAEWARRCLLRGRSVELVQGERRLRGPCGGIAPDGGLLIDLGDGPQRFYSGVLILAQ